MVNDVIMDKLFKVEDKKNSKSFDFETISDLESFLKKYDCSYSDMVLFYKNIEIGTFKVSYYDWFGTKYPKFQLIIKEESFNLFFGSKYSIPIGDDWNWVIYEFKELENMYLFIDGEYLSSYKFLYNESFSKMSRQEISDYLVDNYF